MTLTKQPMKIENSFVRWGWIRQKQGTELQTKWMKLQSWRHWTKWKKLWSYRHPHT